MFSPAEIICEKREIVHFSDKKILNLTKGVVVFTIFHSTITWKRDILNIKCDDKVKLQQNWVESRLNLNYMPSTSENNFTRDETFA